MNVIIYNINSFGGNYEYAQCLFKAYQVNAEVRSCIMLMPSNATTTQQGVIKNLYKDIPSGKSKVYKKLHFVFRSLLNPFRLFFFLSKQPPSVILFNDFDQLTAPLWAPFFRLFQRRHRFSVLLHDPDRNSYLASERLSSFTMAQVMSFMEVAFYHGYLPQRGYYKNEVLKVEVPHGIYAATETDSAYADHLLRLAGGDRIIGILGNIRPEKNYDLMIEALPHLSGVKLLIAGNAATSAVSIKGYEDLAKKHNVSDKVIWEIGYLSQARFNAAISVCDVVLLYYKSSFTSQSGILNSIASFKKKVIISGAESSLKDTVLKYQIGTPVLSGEATIVADAINSLMKSDNEKLNRNWDKYIQDSNWDANAAIGVKTFNRVSHEC